MKVLVSPAEPRSIKYLIDGKVSSKPEDFGVDFMWAAGGSWYGVQRKRFHDDFLASLKDGRLQKELGQMQALEQGFLVLEGFGTWNLNGELIEPYAKLDRKGFISMLTSINLIYGVPTYRVQNEVECVETINAIKHWTESEKHRMGQSSLSGRPNVKSKWGKADSEEWAVHFLQGMKGVGPVQAQAIYDHFDGVPMTWTIEGPEEFEKIPGIGKVRAKSIWETLEREQS